MDPLPASLFEVSNDAHLSIYVASLGRAVVALHELLQNKRKFKEEGGKEGEDKEKAAAGEKEKAAAGALEKGSGEKGKGEKK